MAEAQNPLTPAPVRIGSFSANGRFSTNLTAPPSVLAIGAHPDDADFCAGATLAKWAGQGTVVNIVVCTDGSKGTWDPKASTESLIATRQAEQRAAAGALGATGEVAFLGWPDGELESGMTQREQIAWWIRKLKPSVVMGHDPWKRHRLHPDHRHAGWLTCDGVVAARDPLFFPHQPFPHHRPDALLLWEADEPDHAEDVTDFVEAKYQALLAHASQFETTMDAGHDPELALFRQRLDDKLRAAGEAAGMGRAEVFKLIDDL